MEINQELADKFYALADKINVIINPNLSVGMGETRIHAKVLDRHYTSEWEPNDCGTVGCAAGWCAVALKAYQDISNIRSYDDGISAANKHLGVKLQDWAENHPGLWGNDMGRGVWCHPEAWGQDECNDVFPPSVLAEHLRGVARRIEAKIAAEHNIPEVMELLKPIINRKREVSCEQ